MTVRITLTCEVTAGEHRGTNVASVELEMTTQPTREEIERIVRGIFASLPKAL